MYLDFLITTMQDVPERHRSLRAAFDHSWQLLSEPERQASSGLSVFRGGFEREAAEVVADATLPILSALVTKSLVRRNDATRGDRYDLHEFVRQYAAERIAPERYQVLRDKHQQYFAQHADALEPAWLGRDQAMLLPQWLAELDNLRAAIAWGLEEHATAARRAESAQLLSTLHGFWHIIGELGPARAQLATLLGRDEALPRPLRAWSLVALGYMALWQGDVDVAKTALEEGIGLMRQLDSAHPFGMAFAQLCLGYVARVRGDHPAVLALYRDSYAGFEAIGSTWGMSESLVGIALYNRDATLNHQCELLERSLAMKRAIGDDRGTVEVMGWLGSVRKQLGDFDTTRRLYQDSLAMQEAIGDTYGAARTLNNMAELLRQQGQYDAAMPYYQQSLKHYQALDIQHGMFLVLHNMGHVLLTRGDVQAALNNFKASLQLRLALDHKEGIALALAGLGGVAATTQRAVEAVVYLAAAQTLLRSINYDFESVDRIDFDRNLAAARDQFRCG